MAMGGVDQELVRKETMRMKKLARKSEMAEKEERWQRLRKFRDGGPFRLFVTVIWPIVPGEFPVRGETSSQVGSSPKKRLKLHRKWSLRWTGRTSQTGRRPTSSRLWLPAQD
ncbi:hypothetical protein GWK47_043897 [Chionoecetes opilio]|uniref:Uncharacterized protein n=1 Tax=Chionoecetes opilio TaxID=41210 RepID=A0A8J4Y9W9_CHIOP|nr:hypothetical protein GWK47_043897 [Chionoecetes opilio]